MREKLKEIFLKSNHQFISGEELSQQMQISRTAIWKQIEELKKEGYQFEAVRKKGYRLLNEPDDISSEIIQRECHTKIFGSNVVYFKSIDSTQTKAHELARQGAKHGTIVIANEQTNGKGRLGRSWFSNEGKGIWMSILLRPSFSYNEAPQITLFASIILTNALRSLYGIDIRIKWPNDLYFEKKKIAGILTEMHGEQDQIHYLIIGIGINTHKTKYPLELKQKAGSLEEFINQNPKRIEILCKFLEQFEKNYELFHQKGFAPFFDEYNQLLLKKGTPIVVTQSTSFIYGQIYGVDENGYLIVKKENGEMIKVVSGDITI
ncbi:biotin--[acetyl-CoA-carboxylase] ligase [Tepidibacillus decaturensis]|uniref:Bifunctional ligase/repressor BirA n=1 Tax=Tepidibacillus decaturensis TaxID=1413211 RepID=A0A135L3P0_9BACI|nr:biotin--[acetyl-CoA-carboxylase] ligase [Tepidibacillus decaturensis]KXG43616.1 hypothetical protein U473_06005 [Tepidibacillus decaturensis]